MGRDNGNKFLTILTMHPSGKSYWSYWCGLEEKYPRLSQLNTSWPFHGAVWTPIEGTFQNQ